MSHHHHKYYQREDGYVYTPEELDAYKVPQYRRNRCVNLWVPLHECRKFKNPSSILQTTSQMLEYGFDQWGGSCHKEFVAFKQCQDQYERLMTAAPVRNIYFNQPWAARTEQVSNEFQKNYRTSPLLY